MSIITDRRFLTNNQLLIILLSLTLRLKFEISCDFTWILDIDPWLLFPVWNLRFGIWNLRFLAIPLHIVYCILHIFCLKFLCDFNCILHIVSYVLSRMRSPHKAGWHNELLFNFFLAISLGYWILILDYCSYLRFLAISIGYWILILENCSFFSRMITRSGGESV